MADQQVALDEQRDAPDVIAGRVGQPGLGDIAADIDFLVVHGCLHAGPGQDMEFGRVADLGGEAGHQVVENALGGPATFDLYHGHGPAVGDREAQGRFCGKTIHGNQQKGAQG